MHSLVHRRILIAGALLAASGVMLGAFGAHALRSSFDTIRLGWWQTAVQYQMWHAIGLVGLSAIPVPRAARIGLLLGLGTIIFSGTLYLMALTGIGWLGAITPVGGALMIIGWLVLAWTARK